jgi:hypothetical protein
MTRQQRRAAERQALKAQFRAAKAASQFTPDAASIQSEPVSLEPSPACIHPDIEIAPPNATYFHCVPGRWSVAVIPPEEDAPKPADPPIPAYNYTAETFKVLACESQADYDEALATLLKEEAPQTTVERLLVCSMAQHRWLMDRALRLQEECLSYRSGHLREEIMTTDFAIYLRYFSLNEKAFYRCVNQLAKLRKERESNKIGFESQKRKNEPQPPKEKSYKSAPETPEFLSKPEIVVPELTQTAPGGLPPDEKAA